MYFRSTWIDEINIPEIVAVTRRRFEDEYRRRFGQTQKGLYRADDWARLAFSYRTIAEIGGSVLDVGIGPGALLNALHLDNRFDQVTGIDIRRYSKLVKLSDSLDIRIMDVRNLSFPDRSFDVVVCMEVLEHLEPDEFDRALRELRRVAAKRLFITIPFREEPPLPSYHKQRFDFDDVAAKFADAQLDLLVRRRGPAWLAITEDVSTQPASHSQK